MTTQKLLTLRQAAVATSVLFLVIASVCAQAGWGRPVELLFLRDGSMLITGNGANIWRVSDRAK